MPVYRGMDRAALDAAYNNSLAVANSAEFLADWERRSSALRRSEPHHLDLPYGSAPRQRLDFFPAATAKAPTLLFIHGGYWQRNSKEMFSFVAEGPREAGFNVAISGYTLAPEVRLDDIVGECRQAVRWLHQHLEELSGDREALLVSGWSAGGHLTAAMMDEPGLSGGLAVSGIFDLEPIRLNYLNEKLRLNVEEARRNSPLLHLPSNAARLIVTVGGDELPELRRQSETYFEAWRGKGLPGEFVALPGRHHYTALEELARPGGILARHLGRLIK